MSELNLMRIVIRADGDEDADACGPNPTDNLGLRVGAVFVILVTSLLGTLFPVITKRVKILRRLVPGVIFEFGKFFGSGVILATALIHLLEPAVDAIGEGNTISSGGCIADSWGEYPYPFALCLIALFFTFVGELFAFRIGTSYMSKRGVSRKTIKGLGPSANEQTEGCCPEAPECCDPVQGTNDDCLPSPAEEKKGVDGTETEDSRWQDSSELRVLRVRRYSVWQYWSSESCSILMTLTLSPPDEFKTLFIVIIFHQMFEGLGLGTRLAFLQLPKSWEWAPLAGAITYSIITPLDMAIGLGARQNIPMSSGNASVVSGILDSLSSGILLYAATVELIAHEFIFSTYYQRCSWPRVFFVLTCFALGAGLMALLGKWA